ncbi:hypothetical protein BDW02DRAFT_649702 [Decorospora gaudefroyi]|uniref:Uncharacterized protein n=1 Tax=Decorospora gaudefroyi TaxID=184978 RepID=A0A6A5K5M4_9PLEO|nr:hypothetical protein BDW02DRAFT_649702 [Decorospora gaudefroyi]
MAQPEQLSASKLQARMQHQDNLQRVSNRYSPCHPESCYHDLECGHRIQVACNTEYCGVNCKQPQRGTPFVCPDCLVSDVRLEMVFESLDLNNVDAEMGGTEAISREDSIQAIANAKLKKLLAQGRRMCKIAPKFADPKLQFWHQFLTEENFEGLEEDIDTVLPDKYKNPPQLEDTVKSNEADRLDAGAEVTFTVDELAQDWEDFVRQFQLCPDGQAPSNFTNVMDNPVWPVNETELGFSVEDEASAAVREAFTMCELSGGHL